MSKIISPTGKELFDAARDDSDDIVSVKRDVTPRKGSSFYVAEVFHRKSDDTYWLANYVDSDSDPYYELEYQDNAVQVEKYETVVTDYRAFGSGEDSKDH